MRLSSAWLGFPLFAAVSLFGLTIGLTIPAFYDWSGADQSYSPPLVSQVVIGLLIGCLAACLAVTRIRFGVEPTLGDRIPAMKFTIRTMLIATVLFAALLSIVPHLPQSLAGPVCGLATLTMAVWSWIRSPKARWRLGAVYGGCYLPYAWLAIGRARMDELFTAGPWIPGLVPAELLRQVLPLDRDAVAWTAAIIVLMEIAAGLWIARRGKRRLIVYSLIVMLQSTLFSFALHAAARA